MAAQQMILNVTGMSCDKCATRVEKALKSVSGVTHADVNLEAAEARVTFTSGTDVSAVEAAVRDAGYTCERK
jgi:Cu+-exporting ATPase